MQHEQGGMTVVEFIGFLVSLSAMLFLLLKQFFDEMKKKRDPKAYAERQRKREQAIKAMMGEGWRKEPQQEERDEELEEEEEKPIPLARLPAKPPAAPAPAPKGYYTPPSEAVAYHVERFDRSSRGTLLINQFPTRKELFMIKEILDKPIALRDEL